MIDYYRFLRCNIIFLVVVLLIKSAASIVFHHEETTGIRALRTLGTSWQPELKDAGVTKQMTDGEVVDKWKKFIDKELIRSIKHFVNDSSYANNTQFLAWMASFPLLDNKRLLVRNGRLFVHKTWFDNVKHVAFGHTMAQIAMRWRLPNVMMLYDGSSIGKTQILQNLPRLVIAKKDGYNQEGILIPNCYFGEIGQLFTLWNDLIQAILKQKNVVQRSPQKRQATVFWRGAIEWDNEDLMRHYASKKNQCRDEEGRLARLEAASLSLDAKKFVGCQM